MSNNNITILEDASPDGGHPGGGARRVLTVRYGALIGRLLSLPDPTPEELRRLSTGADLLGALAHEALPFGSASPGLREDDGLAACVLALTDEAFEAAWEILEEGSLDGSPYGGDPAFAGTNADAGGKAALVRAVSHGWDEEAFEDLHDGLLSLPGAPDPSVAAELV